MSSTHTALTSTFSPAIAMMTDGDDLDATSARAPLELVHDNTGYLFAQLAAQFLDRAARLREVRLEGTTITDTAESMAASQCSRSKALVAIKTAQSFGLGDWDRFNSVVGVPASITSLITDAANDGARILAIGTGGNRCTFSDDNGNTWSAGGNIGATPKRLVWNANKGKFIATVGVRPSFSTDGTAWTQSTTVSVCEAASGLAVLSNGTTVGINSLNAFFHSTDGGANWVNSARSPNDPGALDDPGTVAGNNGALIYHAGRHSAGTYITICATTDPTAVWNPVATLLPPGSASFSAQPRIMMCQNTGALFVVAQMSTQTAIYASRDGISWLGPLVLFPTLVVDGFAAAGGRLLATFNDMLFAADGIGGY